MKQALLLLILFIYGCSTHRNSTGGCNENENFKKQFFQSIAAVENYMMGLEDKESYLESLNFIAKYTDVSWDKMLNYDSSYPNFEEFLKDKKEWITWYDQNKCNNIRIK